MVIRNKRRTLFWVNNDRKTYTRISFSIHDYKSQLMDMGAAQSKCNPHETLATLRGTPPPKVVQGENRYFSENSSTHWVWGTETQDIATGELPLPVHTIEEICPIWTSLHGAEKFPIPTKSTTTHTPLRTLCTNSSNQLHLEGQAAQLEAKANKSEASTV